MGIRFNSMTKYNERPSRLPEFVLYALMLAVFSYFFLNVTFRVGVILVKLAIEYWWASIILLFLFIIIRKFRGKKKS